MDNNENNNLTFGEKPIVRFRQKTRHIIKNITIEPLLLVHSLAYGIVCLYVPTLYFDKICRVRNLHNLLRSKHDSRYENNIKIKSNIFLVLILKFECLGRKPHVWQLEWNR